MPPTQFCSSLADEGWHCHFQKGWQSPPAEDSFSLCDFDHLDTAYLFTFFFFWKYLLSCICRKLDFTLLLDSRWQSHLLSSSNWLSFFLQNLLALGQIMHPRLYCVSPQSSVTCLWNKFPTVSLQAASFLYRKFDKNEWKSVFLLPKLSHFLWRECTALHFIMPKVVANEFSTSTWALNPQFYH